MTLKSLRTCMVVAALVLVTLQPAAAGTCYKDWSTAGPIVRKEGLVTVEELTELAKSKLPGEIVRATLCEDGGTYTYRLVVKGPNGQMRNVTVDARDPF